MCADIHDMTFTPKFPCLDAPKYVNVTAAAEQQEPDGRSSVMLTCSSHSYPRVKKYSWYRKMSAEDKKGEKVSDWSSYKVPSDKPGYYYCIAENDIDKKSSDPVQLFVHREWIQDHMSICVLYHFNAGRDVEDTKCIFAVFTLMFSSHHRRPVEGPEVRLPFSDYPACYFISCHFL